MCTTDVRLHRFYIGLILMHLTHLCLLRISFWLLDVLLIPVVSILHTACLLFLLHTLIRDWLKTSPKLKSYKSLRVIIKNLHFATDSNEISSALEEIGFTVRQVTNIKQHQTKIPLPVYFVDLDLETTSKGIFSINSLLNTKI